MLANLVLVPLLLFWLLPFDCDSNELRQCQEAPQWTLNGRSLVRDYRGRVLLLVFVSLDRSQQNAEQCEQELNKLEALPEQFPDIRVLAIAPRGELARNVRAFAWRFPRIRFELETQESPVWSWFGAKHLDRFIFDRCSRFIARLPPHSPRNQSVPDFASTLSGLQSALSSIPCGHCEFDSAKKRVKWPSFHPPVPKQSPTARIMKNEDITRENKALTLHAEELLGAGNPLGEEARQWRRWNSPAPSSAGSHQRRSDDIERQRLHWTVQKGTETVAHGTVEQQKGRQKVQNSSSTTKKSTGTVYLRKAQQIQYTNPQRPQQQKYLYGQQLMSGSQQSQPQLEGERERMLRERERQERERQQQWVAEQQRLRAQQEQQQQEELRRRNEAGQQPLAAHRQQQHVGAVRSSKDPYDNHRNQQNGQNGERQQQQQQQIRHPQRQPQATTPEPEPAPLYPEGSEDAGGEDYYGDEYAAEWTTEAPEAMKQIPKPTKPAMPTTPTTQADKNFGFELPCTGFTDESCFQQQMQLRPSEVHRCCRGRILFTDQCMPGKCSNATLQLCCIQKFLQAKLSCCSDERQADTEVGDHFSRCCFENFVESGAVDLCCPRSYAADQWKSVHELCLPNVELDLSRVKVPTPLIGTSLTTDFDFSKTDKWRFECRYGSHVQQYSYFEEEEEEKGEEGEEND